MFNYFITKNSGLKYPIKKYSRMDFIKRKYNFDINKTIEYYRYNRERAVNNKHMLTRLINMVSPANVLMSDIDYLRLVDANARYYSRQFKITSNIEKGKVFDDVIYGGGSNEVYLYTENELDVFDLDDTILNSEPVRVISTSLDVIDFNIPYENVKFDISKNTVFEIDIRLMCMMYKYWCKDRIDKDRSTDANVFVSMIVLPNILYSLIDNMVYNRYVKIALGGTPSSEVNSNNPFVVINYLDKLDEVLEQVVKDTKNKPIPLEQIMGTIPTLVNDNMGDVLRLHHSYYTRQSLWVLYYSRLSYIVDIIKILGKRGMRRNHDLLKSLPIYVKEIERGATDYILTLKPEMALDFEEDLDFISKVVGKR